MKKIISLLLALALIFGTVSQTAFALQADEAQTQSVIAPSEKNPIIYIRGNGNPIYDRYGNMSYPLSVNDDELTDSLVNSLMGYFVKAVTLGKWTEYYDAFERELGKFFEGCALDENGNIANDSGIANACYDINDENMNSDYLKEDGNSELFSYVFWYDWRLDPFEIADRLEEYIDHVLAATGAEKVSVVGKCLGGSFVLAYLAKYGGAKLRRVAFDCTVGGGCEEASDLFSGKAKVDFEAMERDYIDESMYITDDSEMIVNEFIRATLDLVNETDRLKLTQKAVNDIYKLLSKQLTPRLCMATFGGWPGYWTNVKADSYEQAKNIIFYGAVEGYAEKYKGLIEKLDRYDVLVRQRIPELLLGVKDEGVDFGVLAKYGWQISPLIESGDMLGDALVSLEASSFGATCSKVYETLSDEYIAEKEQAGLGKYIAPDKQVDASTCVFPDSTWMIKGMTHENWAECNDKLIYTICTSKEPLTIDSLEQYPQFMVYSAQQDNIFKMTAENCDVTNWDAQEIHTHSLARFFEAYINFVKSLIAYLKDLMNIKPEVTTESY